MTEAAAPATAETATTTAPAATTTTEQRPSQAPANDFSIPDAYKEKSWATKIKTQDDVWKQLDGAQELIGKKKIVPDFDTAKPEEIEEYFTHTRPADKAAYKFGDGADEAFTGVVADMFLKNGVSAYQGNKIIEGYQAYEKQMIENARSADGFKAEMTKSFGEKFDGNVSAVVKEHKAHLSTEDQALMDSMPNTYLGAVYRLTEAMRKAYGAAETSAAAGEGGNIAPQDHDAILAKINTQITELQKRPHNANELQKLVDERHNVFVNKVAQGRT